MIPLIIRIPIFFTLNNLTDHEKGGLKIPILAGRPFRMAPKQLWTKCKQERNTIDFISTFGPNAQR